MQAQICWDKCRFQNFSKSGLEAIGWCAKKCIYTVYYCLVINSVNQGSVINSTLCLNHQQRSLWLVANGILYLAIGHAYMYTLYYGFSGHYSSLTYQCLHWNYCYSELMIICALDIYNTHQTTFTFTYFWLGFNLDLFGLLTYIINYVKWLAREQAIYKLFR